MRLRDLLPSTQITELDGLSGGWAPPHARASSTGAKISSDISNILRYKVRKNPICIFLGTPPAYITFPIINHTGKKKKNLSVNLTNYFQETFKRGKNIH